MGQRIFKRTGTFRMAASGYDCKVEFSFYTAPVSVQYKKKQKYFRSRAPTKRCRQIFYVKMRFQFFLVNFLRALQQYSTARRPLRVYPGLYIFSQPVVSDWSNALRVIVGKLDEQMFNAQFLWVFAVIRGEGEEGFEIRTNRESYKSMAIFVCFSFFCVLDNYSYGDD